MKTIFVTFFSALIILAQTSSAQSIFQKNYGANISIGYSLVADSSGYLIAGTINSTGQGGQDMLIIKTDLDGIITWAKTIGGAGNEVAYAAKASSDGGYIIVGSASSYSNASTDSANFYVVKTNASGNVQWTRVIGLLGTETAKDVIETYDHKFAIVGFTKSIGAGNEDIYLTELDSAGNLLWANSFGSSGSDFGNSLVQAGNHNFLIVGSTTGFSANGQIPYLVIADEHGVLQNSYTFDLNTTVTVNKRYFTKIIEGYSNDYVITGSDGLGSIGDAQHFLLSISQTGSINWMEKYYLNSGEGVGTSLDKTLSGGFIIGGTMGIDHPALINTDATGGLLSTKFYPDVGSPYSGKWYDVKQDPYGGFALLGYRYASGTTVYLVRTNGNLSSGCNEQPGFINTFSSMSPILNLQTSISVTDSNYVTNDSGVVAETLPLTNVICSDMAVSENVQSPETLKLIRSDNSIEFILDDNRDHITELNIFSTLGNKIKFTNHTFIFLNRLAQGIYYYQVLTKNQNHYTGKFIW